MPPALAIAGAAVVGAGATIIAGNSAANAQEKSAQAAINEQQAQYNQTRADYAPWRAAGQTALGSLMSAYGLGGSGAIGSAGSAPPGTAGTTGAKASSPYGGFFQSPGYQWQLDQGIKAIDHGAASQGLLGSGATVKAEQRYAEGLAGQDFGNYTSGLAQIAGLGTAGTNATTAAGSTAASNISNELIASGNARASSYANAGSGINSGLNNIMSAYLMQNMGMFNNAGASAYGPSTTMGFSDRRLKKNIELVRRDADGLGWYNWNWKATGEKAFGVLADEVKRLRPWAYVPNWRDGYDGVNYAALRAV